MSETAIELFKEIQQEIQQEKEELKEDIRSLCQEIFEQQKRLAQLEIDINTINYRLKKLEDAPNRTNFGSMTKINSMTKI